MKKKEEEKIVTVHMVEDLPDGTWRVGNSYECGMGEAVELIRAGKAKDWNHARGEVPTGYGAAVVEKSGD